MAIRMRRPEEVKVPLSGDDWIVVKKHLTAGETRAMFTAMLRERDDKVNPMKVGPAQVLAYLLDWSVQDPDGKPIVIRGEPEDVVASALDALDQDAYMEIQRAVEGHVEREQKAKEAEKNAPDGESAPPAISSSAA